VKNMDKETIKNRIDFNNIQEIELEDVVGIPETIKKYDYLVDFEGNFILPLSLVELKLIEWIKILEERIKTLEERIIELEKR